MVSKEQFVDILKKYKKSTDKLWKLPNQYLRLAILDYSVNGLFLDTLALAVGDIIDDMYGSHISWWVYETNYGKNKSMTTVTIKCNGKSKKYKLDTAEKLYDFIVEQNKKRNKENIDK